MSDTEVEHLDQILVRQPGNAARFGAEAIDGGATQLLGIHQLERHGARQIEVQRLVDDAHRAATELAHQLVGRARQE